MENFNGKISGNFKLSKKAVMIALIINLRVI